MHVGWCLLKPCPVIGTVIKLVIIKWHFGFMCFSCMVDDGCEKSLFLHPIFFLFVDHIKSWFLYVLCYEFSVSFNDKPLFFTFCWLLKIHILHWNISVTCYAFPNIAQANMRSEWLKNCEIGVQFVTGDYLLRIDLIPFSC